MTWCLTRRYGTMAIVVQLLFCLIPSGASANAPPMSFRAQAGNAYLHFLTVTLCLLHTCTLAFTASRGCFFFYRG